MTEIHLSDVAFLEGSWTGTGHAEYPTIAPADYREELVFTSDQKHPILHYVQRTWRTSPESRDPDPLFWETGFLIEKGSGVFELASAQQSGRLEILRGSGAIGKKSEVILELNSISIVNDDRILKSRRIFRILPKVLEYELRMSTTANPKLQIHVSARLTKEAR